MTGRATPEQRLVADLVGVATVDEALRLLSVEELGRLIGRIGLDEARRQLGRSLRHYQRLAELAGALVLLEAGRSDVVAELTCAVTCAVASIAGRPQ